MAPGPRALARWRGKGEVHRDRRAALAALLLGAPGAAPADGGPLAGLLPITFLSGVGDESACVLLAAPRRFTAARDIGDFSGCRDDLNAYGVLEELPPRVH